MTTCAPQSAMPETAAPTKLPLRIRHDNENTIILINPESGSWLCANQSMLEILNLCDGTRTVKGVADAYAARFQNADPAVVLADVTRVLQMAANVRFVTLAEGPGHE